MNKGLKKTNLNQNSFFDLSFFKYTFATTSKRISIYIVALAYLLMITIVINLVPYLAKQQPIWILWNPIVVSFFVFGNSTVISIIVIEIFRTPIEDGTEIITMSKPLSRWEISIVKMSIFFIYVFTISLCSSAVASFVFLNSSSSIYDSAIIVIGMFVGTFVCSIIFGGISIILSVYCRKVISLLIILCITFSITLFNVFVSLSATNPFQIFKKQDARVKYINLLSNKTNDTSTNKLLDIKYGSWVVSNNEDVLEEQTPSTLYSEARQISNWDILSYFNLSGQLSTMFFLNAPAKIPNRLVSTANNYSDWNQFIFEDYNIDNEKRYIFNLVFPKEIDELITNKNDLITNSYLSEFRINNEFRFYRNNQVKSIRNSLNYDDISNYYINSNLFDEAWNKYYPSIKKEIDLNYKKYFDKLNTSDEYNLSSIPNPLSILVTKIASDYKMTENNFNKFNDYITKLLFSALSSFMNGDNIDIFSIFDIFNVDESIPNIISPKQIVRVRNLFPSYDNLDVTIRNKVNNLLQMNVDGTTDFTLVQKAVKANATLNDFFLKKLDNRLKNIALLRAYSYEAVSEINPTTTNLFYETNLSKGYLPKNWLTYDQNDIDYENNYIEYGFTCLGIFKNENIFKTFQLIKSKSLYDSRILYPVWLCVGILFFTIGILLYSKKDYA